MTRAGCPILVTFSFAALVSEATGRANSRSRILSTERLEAPQTRTRLGRLLEFVDDDVLAVVVVVVVVN